MAHGLLKLGQGVLATCLIPVAFAQAPACGPERYFAPDDQLLATPLSRPHADFSHSLKLATAGNAGQQRSVAIYYQVGYLVEACPAKALYWYRKAAASGDDEARRWLARHEFFEKFRAAPECAAASCPTYSEGPQRVELYAGPNGGYLTSVTINGVTVSAIVDTGATFVSMSASTAQGMRLPYEAGRSITMQTANGTKSARLVSISSVRVGNIVLNDVLGAVSDAEMPLLLGMSFLGRLNVSIKQGSMTLASPELGSPVNVVERKPPQED